MAKNKKILTDDENRLIYIEPNCSDRGIPNTEDFSISVKLTSIKKSRTTLINGDVSSTAGSSKPIGFIDGTNIGGERRSLTTNYTEIGTNFFTENKFGEKENDLETLGIESIDITFDTAYTPVIKIKFIDIRGNALLSKGNDSRYKMFFDLPFPIFDLTVKGFYGKAVKYCLHLTRWNASFNSGTGNFEIDTEFIGYTYALLTDCLLGYMRATVFTKIGATKLQEYQNMPLLDENNKPIKRDGKLVKKYPQLTSIEDFLDYIKKISDEFGKIKTNDDNIKQLNILTNLSSSLTAIENRITDLKKGSIGGDERDKFDGLESKLALLKKSPDYNNLNGSNSREKIDDRIKKYKENQKNFISSINKDIEVDSLKIKIDEIQKIVIYPVNYIVKDTKLIEVLHGGAMEKSYEESLEKTIKDGYNTNNTEDLYLFDFKESYGEIERVRSEIRKRKELLEDNLTSILKSKVDTLTFKPTIRNIVNILCIHAQIFLETLREVSKEAEKSQTRKTAIKKLPEFNKNENKDKQIYPWPEYRKVKNGTLVETWIGSDLPEGQYENVNEVMFVEELLTNLMKIAKEDELRELAGSTNISDFFPVSPAEARIPFNGEDDSLILNNPYNEALKSERSSGTVQEAIRCLLFRTFTYLGVTNRLIGKRQISIMGKLEADNLLSVLEKDFDTIPKDNFIRGIRDLASGTKGIPGAVEEITELWSNSNGEGYTGTTIEGVSHPEDSDGRMFYKDVSISKESFGLKDIYVYKYIRQDNGTGKGVVNDGVRTIKNNKIQGNSLPAKKAVQYIPISGGFDGKDFYKDTVPPGTFSTVPNTRIFKSKAELVELSKELIFTSTNYVLGNSTINNMIKKEDDGALLFKILADDDGIPIAGSPTIAESSALDEYKKTISESSNEIRLLEEEVLRANNIYFSDSFSQQATIEGDALDMYNSIYKTLEIDKIYYTKNEQKGQAKAAEDTVLKAYFYGANDDNIIGVKSDWVTYVNPTALEEWCGGTFLAKKRLINSNDINVSSGTITKKEFNTAMKPYTFDTLQWVYDTLKLSDKEDSDYQAVTNDIKFGSKTLTEQGTDEKYIFKNKRKDVESKLFSPLSPYFAAETLVDGLLNGKVKGTTDASQYQTREVIGQLANGKCGIDEVYVPFVDMSFSNLEDNDTGLRYDNAGNKSPLVGDNFPFAHSFSLFGSLFYYSQETDEAKAFLFLHTISWEGVIGDVLDSGEESKIVTSIIGGDSPDVSLFDLWDNKGKSFQNDDTTFILKGVYGSNGSFTKAPKLWCAFIGALLYRFDKSRTAKPGGGTTYIGDIIKWNSAGKDPHATDGTTPSHRQLILPYQTKQSYIPKTHEYLRYNDDEQSGAGLALLMDLDRDFSGGFSSFNQDKKSYAQVDNVILNLPKQVREEFKRIFISFVNNDFETIQRNYELFSSAEDLKTKHKACTERIVTAEFLKVNGKNLYNATSSSVSLKIFDSDLTGTAKRFELVSSAISNGVKAIKISDLKFVLKEEKAPLIGVYHIAKEGKNAKGANFLEVFENYENISPIPDIVYSSSDDNVADIGEKMNFYTKKKITNNAQDEDGHQGADEIFQFDLTLSANGGAQKHLSSLFAQYYDVMNAAPRIFRPTEGDSKGNYTGEITCAKEDFDRVLTNFFKRFLELTKDKSKDKNDRIQQKIFNNVDDDIIKLNIYRTLSSINDKWLGGETKNLTCTNIDKIAESFRFLDAGFLDIGDKFLINPLSVQQKMVSNYNQSFFDLVNTILLENNFNFIALPSFIDFTTAKKMKEDVFTPYAWSEEISDTSAGAAFVCVYVGQKSSNLNLNDPEHKDDGFSIISDGNCDDETETLANPLSLPDVFKNEGKEKGYKIPYFLVSYGKGNQSIFKDVKLDQREFTETAESLESISDISDTGDKTSPSYKGQNLFNVYQKRAYSAEVEMMGNVTIQPMMYFQLNNIPMFKGAYLIHNTTHSITAHNMKTTFKGSRIKKVKTPLITEVQLFQSLIGSVTDGGKADTISNKKIKITSPLTPPDTVKSKVIKIG